MHLSEQPLPINCLIFLLGALAVWIAGTKLSQYVDIFADRTGLGHAFAGALFLGVATSLPELATTITAASSGAAKLAGSNLLGGVAMQVAVLALVDALVLRGKPLTLFSPRSSLLIVGVMLIMLNALAAAAVASGELWGVMGIGAWPVILFLAYLVGLWVIYRYEGNPRWEPSGEVAEPPESAADLKDAHHTRFANTTTASIVGLFGVASCGVLVGGFFVAKSSEAIAQQTGLGENLIGATLVALVTSLPEVSTTWSAVRFGAYSMAAANILGTNSLEIALFLPAEIFYRDGLIFDTMESSTGFLAALGIIVTSLYLWGILERKDKTIVGMGYDSFAVLLVYGVGIAVFSTL